MSTITDNQALRAASLALKGCATDHGWQFPTPVASGVRNFCLNEFYCASKSPQALPDWEAVYSDRQAMVEFLVCSNHGRGRRPAFMLVWFRITDDEGQIDEELLYPHILFTPGFTSADGKKRQACVKVHGLFQCWEVTFSFLIKENRRLRLKKNSKHAAFPDRLKEYVLQGAQKGFDLMMEFAANTSPDSFPFSMVPELRKPVLLAQEMRQTLWPRKKIAPLLGG